MADDFVRVEIGFAGGQILSWLVTPGSADALERNLSAGASGTLPLDGQEGTITLVLDAAKKQRVKKLKLAVGCGNEACEVALGGRAVAKAGRERILQAHAPLHHRRARRLRPQRRQQVGPRRARALRARVGDAHA